jgi:GT2 family glycosyltransferase
VTTTAADLAVIVVNWNTVDLLDDCLTSIVEHAGKGLHLDVVVVDNASSDGSVEHLAARWPEVRVIANTENLGFCRANNQAIRETEAPRLLLVNTDARLTAGCLERMLRHLDDDPLAAVVGPRLVYADGTFQRWTAGQCPSLRSCATYLLGFDRWAGRRPALSGLYLRDDTTLPFRPGWVTSAVMLLRREALDQVGLLDESIFVYMDDVDLCQRAADAGWHVWYAADATAVHFMGASSRRLTGAVSPEALRALNRWFEARHGRERTRALRALETVGFGARASAYTADWLVRHDEESRQRARAHWVRVKASRRTAHA